MRTINFKDPQVLHDSFGKKCQAEVQAIGFPSDTIKGTLLRAEFNTQDGSIRVIVEIDGIGLSIPVNHILTMSVEE